MKKISGQLLVIACQCFMGPFAKGQGLYSGAAITVNGNASINIQDGGFYNSGQFAASNGTVIISGTAPSAVSIIGGSSATHFYHLSISKTFNGAELANNISVDGNLLMDQGNLSLNGFTIDLGSGAGTIVNERNNAAVTGTSGGAIVKTMDLDAPVAVNPGNLGVLISSPAHLGTTVIRRGHQQQTLSATLKSIGRYYDIVPANDNALNASLQLFYLDNELGGADKSALRFFTSDNNGASFSYVGEDNSSTTGNWVLKNNIDHLSRWTLAPGSSALPVRLISFTARAANGQTLLQWVTTQEINSDYFTVQRSGDGLSFTPLLRIAAQGNSSVPYTYTVTDTHPLAGKNYYRLQETDLDGQQSLSPVAVVDFARTEGWSVFPNPVAHTAIVSIHLLMAKQVTLGLYNGHGQCLQQKQLQLPEGSSQLQWEMDRLPAGTYYLQIAGAAMPPLTIIHP